MSFTLTNEDNGEFSGKLSAFNSVSRKYFQKWRLNSHYSIFYVSYARMSTHIITNARKKVSLESAWKLLPYGTVRRPFRFLLKGTVYVHVIWHTLLRKMIIEFIYCYSTECTGSSGKIPNPKCLQADLDFDIDRKPQERIQGSLRIYDTRQARPRSPPLGVYHGNFQLCKW